MRTTPSHSQHLPAPSRTTGEEREYPVTQGDFGWCLGSEGDLKGCPEVKLGAQAASCTRSACRRHGWPLLQGKNGVQISFFTFPQTKRTNTLNDDQLPTRTDMTNRPIKLHRVGFFDGAYRSASLRRREGAYLHGTVPNHHQCIF